MVRIRIASAMAAMEPVGGTGSFCRNFKSLLLVFASVLSKGDLLWSVQSGLSVYQRAAGHQKHSIRPPPPPPDTRPLSLHIVLVSQPTAKYSRRLGLLKVCHIVVDNLLLSVQLGLSVNQSPADIRGTW